VAVSKEGCCLVSTNVRKLEMDGMGMVDWFAVELLKPLAGGEDDSPGQEQV